MLRLALDVAGYDHEEATPESVERCFLDYVDAGYWLNLTLEDAESDIEDGIITLDDMCRALIRR